MWLITTMLKTANVHTAHSMYVFPKLLDLTTEKAQHASGEKHYCRSTLCEPVCVFYNR